MCVREREKERKGRDGERMRVENREESGKTYLDKIDNNDRRSKPTEEVIDVTSC